MPANHPHVEVLSAYRPLDSCFRTCPAIAVVLVHCSLEPPAPCDRLLLAFAAGWAWKFILVTRAGYNQGFALKHTPVRGAGIAGPPVKPGWILP